MGSTKKFEELDLIDNFLANAMAQNQEFGEEFYRMLLTVLLQREIGKIRVVSQSALQGETPDRRGVRLDVEVNEADERTDAEKGIEISGSLSETGTSETEADEKVKTIYDVEPHRKLYGEDLPRRNRFSQARIDARSLRSGEKDFRRLPDLYVISILDYDPFGYDHMVYTVHNQCDEVKEITYDDGLRFLYFYTKGKKGGTKEIRELLEFIQNSDEDKAVNATLSQMYQYVKKVKMNPELEENYMMLDEYIWYKQRETAAEVAAKTAEETIVSTTQENILELLEDLGEIPEDIRERIRQEQDIALLKKWLKTAHKVKNFDGFRQQIF